MIQILEWKTRVIESSKMVVSLAQQPQVINQKNILQLGNFELIKNIFLLTLTVQTKFLCKNLQIHFKR